MQHEAHLIGKRRAAAGAVGGQPLSGNRPGGMLERGVEAQPIEIVVAAGDRQNARASVRRLYEPQRSAINCRGFRRCKLPFRLAQNHHPTIS